MARGNTCLRRLTPARPSLKTTVDMINMAFLALALTRPTLVGALAPSSRRLARAMAKQVGSASAVFELGAGTGAVTAALRAAAPHSPLLAVELQRHLAAGLKRRFPDVEVSCAAAHEVLEERALAPGDTVLVSSLPFRSLPEPLRTTTLQALLAFVEAHPGRRLVQYTYQPRAPFSLPRSSRLQWTLREVVWGNLPPAGVWVLQNADAT